jgi:hypothetical protein
MLVDFFKNLPWYILYPGKAIFAGIGGYVSQNPQIFPAWAVLLGGAAALWVVVAFLWHAMNTWREHNKKSRLRLEPSHVIILGLTIAAIGVIWQMRVAAPNAQVDTTKNASKESLAWVFSGMAGKSDINGFRVGDIQFSTPKNETGKAVRLVEAYIQSGIDGGKRRPLLLNTYEHGLIPLAQANPIPPNTENVTLMAEFPELSESDFMKDWGNITFVIQDSDHTFRGKVEEQTFRLVFDGYRPKAPPPHVTKAPPEPYYSAADKDRISEALYKLQEILNKPLVQLTVESGQLLSWWEQNRNNRADQRPDIEENLRSLDSMRALSTKVYTGIFYKGVIDEYQVYGDLLRDVLQISPMEREQPIPAWGTAANNLHLAITTFQSAFVHSDARTREGLVLLINPTQDAFREATDKLRAWGQQCNERIEAKRKALRQ